MRAGCSARQGLGTQRECTCPCVRASPGHTKRHTHPKPQPYRPTTRAHAMHTPCCMYRHTRAHACTRGTCTHAHAPPRMHTYIHVHRYTHAQTHTCLHPTDTPMPYTCACTYTDMQDIPARQTDMPCTRINGKALAQSTYTGGKHEGASSCCCCFPLSVSLAPCLSLSGAL